MIEIEIGMTGNQRVDEESEYYKYPTIHLLLM